MIVLFYVLERCLAVNHQVFEQRHHQADYSICYGFTVFIAIFERSRKTVRNQSAKFVLGLRKRIRIAMPIYSHNSVCVFCNYNPIRIHTESPYKITIFFCPVNNFAFIYVICYMIEYFGGKFNPYTNIYPVICCLYSKFCTNFRYPF